MSDTPDQPTDPASARPQPSAEQARTNERVARATGILALGNILSRVLGLAREIVLSNIFGSSRALESFNNALVISKSLYDLLLAGHVNSAIVPVLSEWSATRTREELWRLVSVLVSMVTVIASGVALLLIVFAPQIVGIISGDDAQTQALSAQLLQFTAPALVFLFLFAVLSGTLYALRQFSLPALAGVVFNGCMVLLTLLLIPPLTPTPHLTESGVVWILTRPQGAVYVVALAWVVAALAQMALQLAGLRRARLRLTLNWRHPAVRHITLLYVPVLFSLVIDTLVIRLFSYNLAARASIAHGNTYMNWATTLIQFPQGLVATAISIAVLPTLSRQAALIGNNFTSDGENQKAFKDTLGLGLRLATMLIVPATIGLTVLATPIIQLIFEHGAFTPADTDITTLALRLYLIGLPFAALDLLLVYAFYARQDTLTPALIGVVSLAVYMAVAVALQDTLGLYSLMVADSVKHITHALISGVLLRRRLNGLGGQRLGLTILKTVFASVIMGAVAWGIADMIGTLFTGRNVIGEIVLVTVSGGAGVIAFVALAFALKIEELRWLASLVKKRLKG